MSLKDIGYRFVKRGEDYNWRHPHDVEVVDVDCTDMSDEEFEAFVLQKTPPIAGFNLSQTS